MKLLPSLALCFFLCGCIGVTPYKKPISSPPSLQEIADAYEKDQFVVDQHSRLVPLQGTWKGEYRRQIALNSLPRTEAVSAQAKLRFNKLFLSFSYSSETGTGEIYFGYEIPNHNYVLSVVGTESSQVKILRGSYQEHTKEFRFYGGYQTPINGDRVNVEARVFVTDNRLDIEFYEKDKSSAERFKSLEFHLERVN